MEATDVVMTIYIPRMYGIYYAFDGMFDKKCVEQCEKKIKEIEKEIKRHNQIYKKLQDQQKVCWLANRKVTYKMDTSKKINDYIEENLRLSAHEERATRRAMNKVQKHLQETLKQAKRTEQKYQDLLEQESSIRASVKKEFNEKNGCNARLPDFKLIKREFRR